MKARVYVSLLTLFWIIPPGYGQGTINITFDGPPPQPPGTVYQVGNYSESGMQFSYLPGTFGFGRAGGG